MHEGTELSERSASLRDAVFDELSDCAKMQVMHPMSMQVYSQVRRSMSQLVQIALGVWFSGPGISARRGAVYHSIPQHREWMRTRFSREREYRWTVGVVVEENK